MTLSDMTGLQSYFQQLNKRGKEMSLHYFLFFSLIKEKKKTVLVSLVRKESVQRFLGP